MLYAPSLFHTFFLSCGVSFAWRLVLQVTLPPSAVAIPTDGWSPRVAAAFAHEARDPSTGDLAPPDPRPFLATRWRRAYGEKNRGERIEVGGGVLSRLWGVE
jgi:hypothetical protein